MNDKHLFILLATLAISAFTMCVNTCIASVVDSQNLFKALFDGKTLKGWDSPDMSYWSIEDGAITGKITSEHPLKDNQYLVWKDPMSDFELKMDFRMSGSPGINGGFQFRSRLLPGHDMAGYQMDNNLDTPWLARLYEEHGRETLAFRGKKAIIDADGKNVQSDIIDAGGPAWFVLDSWHEYHLICQGSHLMLYINGHLAAEVYDNDRKQKALSGLLGLQLHSGPATKVQFKNIRLRSLAPGDKLSLPTVVGAIAHPQQIVDKTLVVWAAPGNLTQQGGSALTIEDPLACFDGIVFGELAPARWMAGSNFYERTQKAQASYPVETAGPHTMVKIAIVYKGNHITIYHADKEYASYQIDKPQEFGKDSIVVMGIRHLEAEDGASFIGAIDDARIYNVALTSDQIVSLKPNVLSDLKPIAWWNFQNGKAEDVMGAYPVARLVGKAHIANGRLVLIGEGSSMITPPSAARLTPVAFPGYDSPVQYRPRRGVFADPIPFYWKGEYHIFYLRGGIGKVPWEHIISRDLVHWKELPTALVSDGAVDSPDGEHMFTGSVTENNGIFHIFYTGWNPRNPEGREFTMHATSPDLIKWTKHPEDILGPDGVIYKNHHDRDWRDSYVFWNEDEKQHWMVMCSNSQNTEDGVGLLTSKDLKTWIYEQPLKDADQQECPDLFKIGDTWYLIGGDHYSFAKNPRGPFQKPPVCNLIDRPNIYAAKRMFDGKRHIWTGWVWDIPSGRDGESGTWGGTQCLPREIYAGPAGQLYCKPVKEITQVFKKTMLKRESFTISAKSNFEAPDHYMLECQVKLDPGAELTISIRQQKDSGDSYRFILKPEKKQADLTGPGFDYIRPCPVDTSQPIKIQMFVLGTIIECFVNDQYAQTCRAYNYQSGKLAFEVNGGSAKVISLAVKVDNEKHRAIIQK